MDIGRDINGFSKFDSYFITLFLCKFPLFVNIQIHLYSPIFNEVFCKKIFSVKPREQTSAISFGSTNLIYTNIDPCLKHWTVLRLTQLFLLLLISHIYKMKELQNNYKLVGWVLWHINLCRLFNAKSIFM